MGSHVFHKLYYHYVWATKDRLPLIEAEISLQLIHFVEEECRKRGANPMACNTMPNHIHLLVNLLPKFAPATFIGEIKGVSSHKHNHELPARHIMKWQDGYGVVTIREAEAVKVIRYIANQEQLHANRKTSRFLETTEEPEP